MPNFIKSSTTVVPALVLFWLAGYFFFPTNKLHYQFFILIFILGTLWLGVQRQIVWQQLLQSSLCRLAILLCLYFLASLFWSFGTPVDDRIGELKSVIYLACFFIVLRYSLQQSEDFLLKLFKITLFVSLISLIINVLVFFVFKEHTLADRFHGFGRLWNPLWMGSLYGALTVVATGLLSFARLSRQQTKVLLVVTPILFIGVVLTHSRMPIAATLLVGMLTFLVGFRSWRTKMLTLSTVLMLLGVASWAALPYFKHDIERGQSYRLDLWQGAVELIQEKPFIGYGAGSDTPIKSAEGRVNGWHYYHSTYLATVVDTGLLGLSLMMLLLGYAFLLAWRLRQYIGVRLSACLLFYSCLISLTFGEGIISRMNVQWVLVWLPIIIISHYEIRQRMQMTPSS